MATTRRAEHVADTRAALITAARARFATQGYAATGTEEIVADARVTRGALYHHFKDKADLFRAVMEQTAREVAERLVAEEVGGSGGEGDAWREVREGFGAFLDLCVHSNDFQRIVLVEGPAVLGHEAYDELVERFGYSLLAMWLDRAIEQGKLDALPTSTLTRMLAALIAEASLIIAKSDDPRGAREEVGTILDRLLAALEPVAKAVA
jgi:AcrR family transcriptional regulator